MFSILFPCHFFFASQRESETFLFFSFWKPDDFSPVAKRDLVRYKVAWRDKAWRGVAWRGVGMIVGAQQEWVNAQYRMSTEKFFHKKKRKNAR